MGTAGRHFMADLPMSDFVVGRALPLNPNPASVATPTRFDALEKAEQDAHRARKDRDALQREADALSKRVQTMRAALETAAAKFRFYEQEHLAKGTPSSTAKAVVNAEMALLCETASTNERSI
jgi:hypothetical protein